MTIIASAAPGCFRAQILSVVMFAICMAAPPCRAAIPDGWCDVPPAVARDALRPTVERLQSAGRREPRPLVHVHTEHTLPADPVRVASEEAERDLPFMRAEALAWRAGYGEDHLATAERFLTAWIETYRPNYDPIDETRFDALVDTYAITRPALAPATRARAEGFLRSWATGYFKRMDDAVAERASQSSWMNNWQSHRVKLVTMIAVALDDPELERRARLAFIRQVSVNLLDDGETFDFEERDALHYVAYDLEPLLRAAIAARRIGEDWYRPRYGRSSLASAVSWLVPYARGAKTHREFVHSHVAFDAERAGADVNGYSGEFDRRNASQAMWLAAQLDESLIALSRSLSRPPDYVAACGL